MDSKTGDAILGLLKIHDGILTINKAGKLGAELEQTQDFLASHRDSITQYEGGKKTAKLLIAMLLLPIFAGKCIFLFFFPWVL